MLRNLKLSSLALLVCLMGAPLWAGTSTAPENAPAQAWVATAVVPDLPAPAYAPRMAPDLALYAFEEHSALQAIAPPSYTATTIIKAELPDTAQSGEFQLRRRFIAPRTLAFRPVKFSGDGFVKTNVIARLLQAEVDHVAKGDDSQTALSEANYKFCYKGIDAINGRAVHVFQVKPRRKQPGLFKGRIYLDASTGNLRRAEGSLIKTPSFFVKKIDFVQDYEDVGGYTLPTHIRSLAKTRLVGRARVEVATQDYELGSVSAANAGNPAGSSE